MSPQQTHSLQAWHTSRFTMSHLQMPHEHTWHQQPKMVSLFVIFGQWLGHGYTKGNWWLLDMIWGGIPVGKEREERDLWVNWGAAGGHQRWELSDSHPQSRNAGFAGIPCQLPAFAQEVTDDPTTAGLWTQGTACLLAFPYPAWRRGSLGGGQWDRLGQGMGPRGRVTGLHLPQTSSLPRSLSAPRCPTQRPGPLLPRPRPRDPRPGRGLWHRL